jgi:hypothetical protein
MIAHFSSKLKKQINAAFVAILLAICLLGTHWIGLNHGISHAKIQQHSISQSFEDGMTSTYGHSSDICHLFDALTLSGFAPSSIFIPVIQLAFSESSTFSVDEVTHQLFPIFYLSQAPPRFFI